MSDTNETLSRRNVLVLGAQALGVVTLAGAALQACGPATEDSTVDAGTTTTDAGTTTTTDAGTGADAGETVVDAGTQPVACTSPATTIGSNHSHVLTVTEAEVTAGAEKAYDIKGGSSHSHTVTISAADFTKLKNGETVSIVSTSAGHTHTCTVKCA